MVLDAVRNSDKEFVALKRIKTSIHPFELEIGKYLCSPPLSFDKRNHCCPILEVLRDPTDSDVHVIVMPFLRKFYDPKFVTVGEAIDFFRQAFEVGQRLGRYHPYSLTVIQGLQFMHEHHVAHR